MSRLSRYVREKVVKVLVTALVIGSVAGNEGITVQAVGEDAEGTVVESISDGNAATVQLADTFESASLDNPYAFVVYTDEYVNTNHIESNVAIGNLKAEANIWGGCSYIGDFADASAKVKANIRDAYLVIPRNNSDGSENKLVELTGQGYTFYVGSRSFITDVKLLGYKYQDNIKEKISQGLETLREKSDTYYELSDTDNYYQVVYNLTADQFNSNSSCVGNPCNDYTCKIIKAASEGKTVIINILDAGDVTINEMNDNVTHEGTGYQSWATNITWNFGKASTVTTHAIFGYVLAPNATVNNKGNVIGAVFCKTLAQEGEIHRPKDGAPVITPEPTPTATPTATPDTLDDTPDDSDTPDDPGTQADPGIPVNPVTPADPGTTASVAGANRRNRNTNTPQVLGARRRRVVTIEDEAVPLSDKAVLGASRRPQTSDDSRTWNLGFLFSLTGLGAWLIIKKKQ